MGEGWTIRMLIMRSASQAQITAPGVGISDDVELAWTNMMKQHFMSDDLKQLHKMGNISHGESVGEPEDFGPKMVIKSEEEAKEFEFWTNMSSLNFKVNTDGGRGNPVAGRWQRALDGDENLRQRYEATVGRKKRQDFRRDWCKAKYDDYMIEHSRTTEEVRKQWKNSRYLPIGRIAVEEGGGKAGWLQAPSLQWTLGNAPGVVATIMVRDHLLPTHPNRNVKP
jgi:hypothetical protein